MKGKTNFICLDFKLKYGDLKTILPRHWNSCVQYLHKNIAWFALNIAVIAPNMTTDNIDQLLKIVLVQRWLKWTENA